MGLMSAPNQFNRIGKLYMENRITKQTFNYLIEYEMSKKELEQ